MSDGLTFDMLGAAIGIALRLEVEFRKGVAEGSIKADDMAAWANARIEEIIGNSRWETVAKSDRVQGGVAE